MKKIISVILTGIFVLSMFAGCASAKKDGYRVAIVQQMDHASLDEIRLANTPASFEPALDYVVTKMPRFPFDKFSDANNRLGTQMNWASPSSTRNSTDRTMLPP